LEETIARSRMTFLENPPVCWNRTSF